MKKETLNRRVNTLVGEEKAMRVGDIVKIVNCEPMPEVVGQRAEIVDLQMQEYERYCVYPVWVRMLTGERQDKVYGFHYAEVEVVEKEAKVGVIAELEEILRNATSAEEIAEIEGVTQGLRKRSREVKIGDAVTITNCVPMPDLAGERAEVVDLQTQELERYRTYPVWLKVSSGERKGKVYGFQPDEIEWLVKHEVQTAGHKIVKTSLAAEIERIIRDTNTFEEIAEIERAIAEAKGRIMLEPALGFWEGKTPCWETFRCPEAVRNECPAFHYRSLPCWQIEGTYSKLHDNGNKGESTKICENCRVYKRYGNAEPIEIKLRGKGFNRASETATQ
jgi:ribosomal protein S17